MMMIMIMMMMMSNKDEDNTHYYYRIATSFLEKTKNKTLIYTYLYYRSIVFNVQNI